MTQRPPLPPLSRLECLGYSLLGWGLEVYYAMIYVLAFSVYMWRHWTWRRPR